MSIEFLRDFQLVYQFSSVQLLGCVWLFATPWIAAYQASLSITNSQSSLKLMCIKSVMSSSHLILCRPLLLLSPIPPSIRVFSNESTLRMRWPKYWSLKVLLFASFHISFPQRNINILLFHLVFYSLNFFWMTYVLCIRKYPCYIKLPPVQYIIISFKKKKQNS